MKRLISLVLCSLLLPACTSIKVKSVDENLQIDQICINENKSVKFYEFIDTIRRRIEYHHIRTLVFSDENKPAECEYTLLYSALRSWDLGLYLSHAELNLFKGNNLIAEATYHLNGKGGLSLTKWASISSKMNPVVDELLNKK